MYACVLCLQRFSGFVADLQMHVSGLAVGFFGSLGLRMGRWEMSGGIREVVRM